MSDCCHSDEICCGSRGKQRCPVDNNEYIAVSPDTILHHLKEPWLHPLNPGQWYFCDNPACDVVYFGEDGSLIRLDELHGPVGQKQTGKDKPLCYCFHITLAEAKNDPQCREFVIQQTRSGKCSCETSNPSGRCCLKDFP